ncbi:VanZ family protein [Lederbergia lenta]|uniref:Acetobutylicum phosphotransbutyrylase n=1 Tax=Lederbergia lenta TaxID=1467 RepID=A0A2X4ZNY7_LEDLE|nr:VanZ family protein [Lederbergia lenta]MCM3111813.1 VanZ family protein [Lederbergia lenta]MEC2322967.1 VanZ family protein [Lederbergia lenta]SQI62124.1 acetobutylicum phosphotransbutyrylase [Lederbergia lenta]
MNKKNLWLTAAIVWCVAIFLASASPSATGGNTEMLIQRFFQLTDSQAAFFNVAFRKFVHLSAFGLLAILIFNGIGQKRPWLAWLLTTIYAATDEIHQAFLPERTGSVMDVGLDSIGALLAVCGMMYLKKKRLQHLKRS